MACRLGSSGSGAACSAIGSSNNCRTNIKIVGSTVSGTNGSTIISAIGSSNIHADN